MSADRHPGPFGIQVKLPGEDREYARCVATGELANTGDGSLTNVPAEDVKEDDWAVQFPHHCSEWVVATGRRAHVLAEARRFRDELDKVITALERS